MSYVFEESLKYSRTFTVDGIALKNNFGQNHLPMASLFSDSDIAACSQSFT